MVGKVTEEPARGQTGSNKTWIRFRIHVKHGTHPYEREGWFTVKAFGARADKIPYLATGTLVAVRGPLEINKDDQGRLWSSVVADVVYVLENAPEHQGQHTDQPQRRRAPVNAPQPAQDALNQWDDGFSDSDIPF
jgi:single-stranded DNA-binding protein